MDEPSEERLAGGNVGGAVRIGDTVRRSAGPWTEAVHRVLNHLEAAGFEGAPRVLGIDSGGREILTYIEGDMAFVRLPEQGHVEDMVASLSSIAAAKETLEAALA